MKKKEMVVDTFEKSDKKIFLAVFIAIFAILLFIAFALTLPWSK